MNTTTRERSPASVTPRDEPIRTLALPARRPRMARVRPDDAPPDHPIRTPEAQRLWWGYEHPTKRDLDIPSAPAFARAVLDLRPVADNDDIQWWLADAHRRLSRIAANLRAWSMADNAVRHAFLRNAPIAPESAPPRSLDHAEPLIRLHIHNIVNLDKCARNALYTDHLLHARGLPGNSATTVVREALAVQCALPREAARLHRRVSPGASSAEAAHDTDRSNDPQETAQ